MNKKEKDKIISLAKERFKNELVLNHINNTKKLSKLSEFNFNPFLHKYLVKFAYGEYTPENRAKTLIIPRTMGTSINTSFGNYAQNLCIDLKQVFPSAIEGLDIEFNEPNTNKKIYCQLKAGPDTINKDDISVIEGHFRKVINTGRTNRLSIANDQCVLGILYGTHSQINSFYKAIENNYPILVGNEFWTCLTGDKDFYSNLIDALSDVVDELDESNILQDTINALAKDIEENGD